MPVSGFLTDLPSLKSRPTKLELSGDTTRPQSRTALTSLLLPPRVGSAAPVHRAPPLLVAPSSRADGSAASLVRPSISQLSKRRNEENEARLLHLMASEDNETGGRRAHSAMSGGVNGGSSSSRVDDLFAMMTAATLEREKNKTKKDARVSLVSRTSAMKEPNKEQSEVARKLQLLRSDGGARVAFFRDVTLICQEQMEKRRASRGLIQRNVSMARCHTPQLVQERVELMSESRETALEMAKHRKADAVAARQAHYQDLVNRANRTGLDLRTEEEKERERQLVPLYCGWSSIVFCTQSATVFLSALRDKRDHDEAKSHDEEARRLKLLTFEGQVRLIQRAWMRHRRRKLQQRKGAAVSAIVHYLRRVPSIIARFKIAMRMTTRRVVCVQRHCRTVRQCRRLRREQAVECVDKAIQLTIANLDNDIVTFGKEKKAAENQMNAAIKSRKPLFETQIKEATEKILQCIKTRSSLLSLSYQSKASATEKIIAEKERVYRDLLGGYARLFLRQYLVEFNIDKVLKDDQAAYNEQLTRTSLTELRVVNATRLRRDSALTQKAQRPSYCLGVSLEEATQLVHNELVVAAQKDWEEQQRREFEDKKRDKQRKK